MQKVEVETEEEYFIDEEKSHASSGSLRQETELFDEEKYVPGNLISVRRISLPKKGEDWQVIENKKTILTLKGIRFSNKEREFFRTQAGVKFIMDGYRNGWDSISEFKRQVKNVLKKH